MASTDIRQFNFFQKYLWNPTDFDDFQTWLQNTLKGVVEGMTGAAVLSGLKASPGGGLAVQFTDGIAVSPSGRLVVATSIANQTVSSPAGNPARTLIVLRPKLTDTTPIAEPVNPTNTVYLHEKFEYDVVVINGTPAATPVYPATQSDDIIIAALRLNASHATITEADFDLSKVDRPKQKKKKIKLLTASATLDALDEKVEFDATSASGVVTLAPVTDMDGYEVTVVKIDSSANPIAVSGNGGQISGQNSILLESQWDAVTIYANKTSYRQQS